VRIALVGVVSVLVVAAAIVAVLAGRSTRPSPQRKAAPTRSSQPHLTGTAPNVVALTPPSGLTRQQVAVFKAGEVVASRSGCEGCHQIGSYGNNGPGPPLTHIGRLRAPGSIAAALRNPRAPMPSWAAMAKNDPRQFHNLVAFLSMLQ
jgi:mono/diheme cytochrome c family protein